MPEVAHHMLPGKMCILGFDHIQNDPVLFEVLPSPGQVREQPRH
jgi:hypothetical protein